MRETSLGGLEARFGDCNSAPRILDAPRRDRAIGQEAFGARLLHSRALQNGLRFRHLSEQRRAIDAARETRFETGHGRARAHLITYRGQMLGHQASGSRRGDHGLAAGKGVQFRGYSD